MASSLKHMETNAAVSPIRKWKSKIRLFNYFSSFRSCPYKNFGLKRLTELTNFIYPIALGQKIILSQWMWSQQCTLGDLPVSNGRVDVVTRTRVKSCLLCVKLRRVFSMASVLKHMVVTKTTITGKRNWNRIIATDKICSFCMPV